jgi:mevalonate kinase
MIPDSIRPVWEQGLKSGAYTLKLCGAGGGGFLLGIAQNTATLEKLNESFTCQEIW